MDLTIHPFARHPSFQPLKGLPPAERAAALRDPALRARLLSEEAVEVGGDAEVFVPIIHDAVNARVTRFSNQLFPQSGHYLEVTTADGKQPWEIIALENHYIRTGKRKTKVFKPLLRNGDVEGHYNLYGDWNEIRREIVSRETHGF